MEFNLKIITTLAPYVLIPAGIGAVLLLVTIIVRGIYLSLKRKDRGDKEESTTG